MTDEAQTADETAVDLAAIAQDAPAADPAPEVAPEPEAAPEAPAEPEAQPVPEEVPAPAPVPDAPVVENQSDPVEDPPEETDEVEIDITETITIHNPNALRGIPAGPAPHPRTV